MKQYKLYLLYIKRWFTNLFSIHFQAKYSDTHVYVHRGHQTMVIETSKTINF